MPANRHFSIGLIIAVGLVAVDQLSKWWIVTNVMRPPQIIPVTPFFNLVLGWNRGVSFGLFNSGSSWNQWLLPVLALIIVAVLLVWLWRVENRLLAVSIGLIVGGAVGNVIDRINYGAVVDFLDFHAVGFHWPAFNAADSGITVGAIILVLDSLFAGPERHKKGDETGGSENDTE